MKKFNKKKLPSRHTSLGPDKAPQRSFYYAMDLTEKDVAKPFVGVVSTWNEAAPCNIALMRQAQSVKKGVHQAGGVQSGRRGHLFRSASAKRSLQSWFLPAQPATRHDGLPLDLQGTEPCPARNGIALSGEVAAGDKIR